MGPEMNGGGGPAEAEGEGDRTASNYSVPGILWAWGEEFGLNRTL